MPRRNTGMTSMGKQGKTYAFAYGHQLMISTEVLLLLVFTVINKTHYIGLWALVI